MRSFIYLCLLLLLTSCVREEIKISDLDIDGSALQYKIAVEGFISTENTNCRVMLYQPSSINNLKDRTPIPNATVVLKEGDNVYQFDFVEGRETCEYVSRDKIEGIAGQTYTLEIVYEGVNYTASDVIPYTDDRFEFPIDRVEISPYNPGYMDIAATKHNFGFDNFMIYNFYRYSHDSLSSENYNIYRLLKNRIYNHKGSIPQGVFPNVWTYSFVIYANKSDTVEIIKGAISETYYSHLIARFNETDWRSGLFSTVPGNVKTNLSEGGIGFFYAINIKRKLMTMQELADTNR